VPRTVSRARRRYARASCQAASATHMRVYPQRLSINRSVLAQRHETRAGDHVTPITNRTALSASNHGRRPRACPPQHA
jgi:hypothetical protein